MSPFSYVIVRLHFFLPVMYDSYCDASGCYKLQLIYFFLFCYDFSYVNLLTMLSDHKFFLMYAFSMLTPDTIIHHLLLLLQYFVALINSLPFYSLYNRTHYGFNLLMLGCYYYTPLMLFLHCLWLSFADLGYPWRVWKSLTVYVIPDTCRKYMFRLWDASPCT